MYAQATVKRNSIPRNGAYRIVNRDVHFCTPPCSSLRSKNYTSLGRITLDTATDLANWTDGFITYINYELYVPAEVLKAKLDGEAVAEILGDSATVLEVSWGTTEQSGYDAGHIPGAIHVNSDDFDDEDNVYMLESDDVLLKLALSQGITKDSTVVVTGDQIFSCRYATILRYLGVENVFVLTGGANAWVNAGYELSTDAVEVTPATDFGCEVPANESVIDTVEEAEEMLKDPNCLLVDVRTEEERKGETSGYSYFDTAGWIDGSYYGGAGINSSSSMLYYRNIDGTMRNEEEIQKMWVENGLDISRHLSFFCGGGYRAAEAYWDALVMGMWRTTSLFADGWCGWVLAGLDYKTAE